MGYSCWVLVNKTRLPTVAELARAADESGFPLCFDTDWDWNSHSGWLPMSWNENESGCELSLESLELAEIRAAAEAGYPDVDSAVVIETRDWDSLRSGAAFAACLASASGGCISEEEGAYVDAGDATAWANLQIDGADQAQRDEAKRAAARESVSADGDTDALLDEWFRKWPGQRVVRIVLMNDKLCIHLENGGSISGNVWTLRMADAVFEVTRKRTLRGRIPEILGSEDPEEWDMEAYERLLAESEKLGEIDNREMEAAFNQLAPLAGDVEILSVRRPQPHSIELQLAGTGQPTIEYVGLGFLADILVRSPALQFSVSEDVRIV